MFGFDDYAPFILGAYGVTALGIGGLMAWVVLDHRAVRRGLAALEAKGVRRRSDRGRG